MKAPVRLLLVIHDSQRAGTERHVLWLAEGLARRGWEVAVATSRHGPMEEEFRQRGIETHHVPRVRRADIGYLPRLTRLIRRRAPHVVHAHSGRAAALAGRIAHVPAIIETRHGLGSVGEPPNPRRLRREALACRLADRTIVVAGVDRERLITGGLPAQRVVHIANGIPSCPRLPHGTDGGAAGQGTIRLGYVGRLSPEKNPLFLAAVGTALDREIPGRWSLTIAGAGPLEESLRGALSPWPSSVEMLGQVTDIRPLLARLHVLLVPSLHEGQPLSVLEGMQAGVVPVVNDLPSLHELVGGERAAGRLLPLEPATWAQAIRILAEHPEERDALATEGRLRILRDHDVDVMVGRIEQVYRDCFCR